jgi:signal transduction histidine kinase
MNLSVVKVGINGEQDVVAVRQRVRQISVLLGYSQQDQVRIATAVSEIARNTLNSPSGGQAQFTVCDFAQLVVTVRGAGEAKIKTDALAQSTSVNALSFDAALMSAHRLMDSCTVKQDPDGTTTVVLQKRLPAVISAAQFNSLVNELSASPLASSFSEVQRQNQDLVNTLAELRERQQDLLALTAELEDTNRGVVALYAEIEEKAEGLRKADEMKSLFLSNTSHELRTPLSSIRAISKLLLGHMDGELSAEQEKQVQFILDAATDLSELVNDLLDLAKIEAGKVDVQNAPIKVAELFSVLKGMLRPLADNPQVELIFELEDRSLQFVSDEGKIGQLLRNLISNALKFTERGEVRVIATSSPLSNTIEFEVRDTGIGIAANDHAIVFDEFGQIANHLQSKVKGTGLGLPLCRKLAHLLGGSVEMSSELNVGSSFILRLPLQQAAAVIKIAE